MAEIISVVGAKTESDPTAPATQKVAGAVSRRKK
jgi:hypothetical protein